MLRAVERCWNEAAQFDIVHSHVEGFGFPFARHAPVPVVSTLHGRLDVAGMPDLLEDFTDIPLVAISESQRRWAPDANWVGVVHNGLPLEHMPVTSQIAEYLAFVGRIAPEKGVGEAIDLAARVALPLKMAAKVHHPDEQQLFDAVVAPAVARGRAEFLGELSPAARDPLLAGARATPMLGGWPEPFGLVAIESLATGTPVIARRAGALPEIVEHGVDGYLVDDLVEAEHAVRLLDRLDRQRIRRRALERFSATRMADRYEWIYRSLLAAARQPAAAPATRELRTLRLGRRFPPCARPKKRSGSRGSRSVAVPVKVSAEAETSAIASRASITSAAPTTLTLPTHDLVAGAALTA